MKAVIISCDEGSRLRPVTCTVPTPLLPLMGKPVIEHTVGILRRHNINDISYISSYLPGEIKKHFSGQNGGGLRILSHSDISAVSAGDDVLIISDNIITDMDISHFIYDFTIHGCATVATLPGDGACEYGRVITDSDSFVKKYIRCPDFTHPAGSIFAGAAIIPKGCLTTEWNGFPSLMEKLLSEKKLYASEVKGYLKTISDFDSYRKCCRDFMDKKIALPFPCEEKAPSVWIDKDASVMQGSVIVPPVYIGRGSFISKGARIESYTQIGENVSVDCFAGIKRSIIMNNAVLGEGCAIRGAIIGQGCYAGFESAVYEGSVIGDGTKLGKHSTIKSSVHIWPEKYIEDESIVGENIIWENTSRGSLFEDGCANGIINREITPEFAATLGRSAVSLLGKRLAVSASGPGSATMIKNALISGIQSAGGTPYDMGEQPLPITRSAVRFYSLDGAIALSSCHIEGNIRGSLDIINSIGADIRNDDLKALENLTCSGEALRCNPSSVPEPEYLFEYKLYYLKQLVNSTSGLAPDAQILVYCPNTWAQNLLQSAAKDLGCSFVFIDSDGEAFSEKLGHGNFIFGAICDYKCETLTVVKRNGERLSPFDYRAMTSLIIMKSFPDALLYVPESSPSSIEALAVKYGAKVIRTEISPPSIMNELFKNSRKLFLHQYIYQFDAVGAILLFLDFLQREKTTPEELLSEIPVTHTLTTDISCNHQMQGRILQEVCKKHGIVSANPDGSVKISFDDGWVLLVPRRIDSAINVISHALKEEYAREISDILTDEISEK